MAGLRRELLDATESVWNRGAGGVVVQWQPGHPFVSSPLEYRTSSGRAQPTSERGFTLVEVLTVVVIVGILSQLTLPAVHEMKERARIAKAMGDIRAMEIELAALDRLPETLAGIGLDTYLDPWGHPYRYLRLSTVGTEGGGGGAGCGGGDGDGGDGGHDGHDGDDGDDGDDGHDGHDGGGGDCGSLIGQARKDRFLVPLNSDYDLYSMGRDGASMPPLQARVSLDDIVRANDGAFVGLATRY